MPSKEEKRRGARLVEEIARKDTIDAISRMPISFIDLGALFDHFDQALEVGCDRTLKLTEAFRRSKKLTTELIVPWLADHGGGCDCEVLVNVEEKWESEVKKHT